MLSVPAECGLLCDGQMLIGNERVLRLCRMRLWWSQLPSLGPAMLGSYPALIGTLRPFASGDLPT